MDLQLRGKTALVLASSKGLGKAVAQGLAAEGADLVIGSRNFQALEATAEEIKLQSQVNVLPVQVDVAVAADAARFVRTAIEAFGKINILVNNAGGPPFGLFESFSDDDWQKAFDLNLLSAVRMSRLAVPYMRAAGGGRIINITSLSVKTYLEHSVLSTSLRLGVIGMAKMLSVELGPDNITVNNVAPGIILTDRVQEILFKSAQPGHTTEDLLNERAQEIPLKRVGRPEELAALVTFLASPLAGFITGTTIQIDAGAVKSIY